MPYKKIALSVGFELGTFVSMLVSSTRSAATADSKDVVGPTRIFNCAIQNMFRIFSGESRKPKKIDGVPRNDPKRGLRKKWSRFESRFGIVFPRNDSFSEFETNSGFQSELLDGSKLS